MDVKCYEIRILESNTENLIENVTNGRDKLSQSSSSCNQTYSEDKYITWKEVNTAEQIKATVSVSDGSLPCSEDYLSNSGSHQVVNTSTESGKSQKGRVSLVRLQAAVQTPSTEVKIPLTDNVDSHGPKISYADSSSSPTSQLPVITKNCSWTNEAGQSLSNAHYSSSSEVLQDPSVLTSTLASSDELPSQQEMQRCLTSDGQYVYAYKDANGELHIFYPTQNDRETHNEKERKRRSRVSESCADLRRLVPGLTEKTDKATVFEQAARYLQFLREKYGTQFDEVYYERHLCGNMKR